MLSDIGEDVLIKGRSDTDDLFVTITLIISNHNSAGGSRAPALPTSWNKYARTFGYHEGSPNHKSGYGWLTRKYIKTAKQEWAARCPHSHAETSPICGQWFKRAKQVDCFTGIVTQPIQLKHIETTSMVSIEQFKAIISKILHRR